MSEGTQAPPHTLVRRAREAADRGDWQRAHDLFVQADAVAPLDGDALALLADVAYAAGRLDVTIAAWERAYAQALRAGDHLTAAGAAVRVSLHLLFDTAFMAPIRGWMSRAERLLAGQPQSAPHAWLAVVRTYERLLSGDLPSARRWAREAVDIGATCAPAAAAIGRVAEARCLVLEGDVQHGLALLDDAGVAAVSGELDPVSTGLVYCELVCALQGLAQYDLAEQWTAAMERWLPGQPVGSLHGRCRVHRAEILRLRGASAEAEQEALLACEELRPYLRRELGWPLTELGRIRLRLGNLVGAEEAFRAAHELGWDPQPGLALLHLARGDVALAARSIGDALEHPMDVPSKELPPRTDLRRVPLLEAQVEIAVAAGDLALARASADQLSQIAALFGSRALTASAALARGRVELARGDTVVARGTFAQAAQLWSEVGAPYETALARLGLARAHRAQGEDERALLELHAARVAFERVGAVDRAAEAAHAARDSGCPTTPEDHVAAQASRAPESRGSDDLVFRREGEYWSVAFFGQPTRLRDLKGMRYLARLLADPAREFHVLDLVALERSQSASDPLTTRPGTEHRIPPMVESATGLALDAQAKEAYRRRLRDIDEDLEEARSLGDGERAAQAAVERDFLLRELARAVGFDGRDRRVGAASERARVAVTRAIRQTLVRISTHVPALGEHLERTLRTGTYCAYLPDPRFPARWQH